MSVKSLSSLIFELSFKISAKCVPWMDGTSLPVWFIPQKDHIRHWFNRTFIWSAQDYVRTLKETSELASACWEKCIYKPTYKNALGKYIYFKFSLSSSQWIKRNASLWRRPQAALCTVCQLPISRHLPESRGALCIITLVPTSRLLGRGLYIICHKPPSPYRTFLGLLRRLFVGKCLIALCLY